MTVSQENKPIGTSILQFSITDHDSSNNGPPFDFRILSGNAGKEFVLEKDGTLVANQVFRRDLATEYALQIQVNVRFGEIRTVYPSVSAELMEAVMRVVRVDNVADPGPSGSFLHPWCFMPPRRNAKYAAASPLF